MTKHYSNGQELNTKILSGINKLTDNVATTLGPKGRNVILFHKEQGIPVITKDGVTVAKFVSFEDPIENVGAQIVKQAAEQSASKAGDGTTTATVLTRAILQRTQKYLSAGVSPIEIKRGMDKATNLIVDKLRDMSMPIRSQEDIEHIATISANNDKSVGTLIATAVDSAGKDGSVIVEEANSINTSLDLIEGFRFDSGYVSPTFINNERSGAIEYNNPLILITDEKIETIEQILPTLEIASRDNSSLLIVADMEGQALAAVIANAVRGTMKVAVVKPPRYGEERRNILKDLSLSAGATFITKENGIPLQKITLSHFGRCKSIYVNKQWTTVIGGNGDEDEIEARIDSLKTEIQQTDDLKSCERLQERITRLASGVAVIRVGAATEVEMIEKKHRIDDALEAVRSAQEEGIVCGGGVALIRATQDLLIPTISEEESIGAKIILEAVEEPLRQMAKNADKSPDLIVDRVRHCEVEKGYNFLSDELVNMLEEGIVDPVKVTRCALQNAVSVASTLITTSHAIVS